MSTEQLADPGHHQLLSDLLIVSGEIENSGVPAHLVIVESEGMSVLPLGSREVLRRKDRGVYKASGLEQQVKTRKLIIPGYVAQISGELEECLPGWEIWSARRRRPIWDHL